MKVYHPEGSSQTLMVAPGHGLAEIPSDWQDQDGKAKRINVVFEGGVAEVDDKLGKYLIEKGYANRTSLRRVVRKLIH